jgi:anaerobic ribonucleoside-triphosphate reductase activating protein
MNILATQYTLSLKSLDIYVSGCSGNPHCEGCHNPESWNFNLGQEYNNEYFKKYIYDKCIEFNDIIKNIMIFGGEPLDNNHEDLRVMLHDIKMNLQDIPIWLFTRYDIDAVPNFVKEYCDYIKCGRYLPEQKTEDNIQYNIKLATSNQKIYKKGKEY